MYRNSKRHEDQVRKNMDKDHLVTAVLDRLDKKSRAKSMESIVDAAMAIELTPL